MSVSKLGLLLSTIRRPREFLDRVITFSESAVDSGHLGARYLLYDRKILFERSAVRKNFLDEPAFAEIRDHVVAAQEQVLGFASGVSYDAGLPLASFCYAYCRSHRPSVVVETGVAHGVTSAFILKALEVNNYGKLISVDFQPLGASAEPGSFIPNSLRSRWSLRQGRSRRLLPNIFSEAGAVDMFLHDSLHTERNMSFEFKTAWPNLKAGGILISDDVAFNRAFQAFAGGLTDCGFAGVDESALFGVAVKSPS